MGESLTYQNDTIQVNELLESLQPIDTVNKLNIRQAPVILKAIPGPDTTRVDDDTTQFESKPTFEQIRYWRWLREQKMLVDTSRYIYPKNEVQLVSTVKTDEKGLGLPLNEIIRINSDWLTLILLFSLILFATIRNSYTKYLVHLFQSLGNYSTAFRMFREKNYPLVHGAFRLDAYFYLVFSIFIYQVLNFFQVEVAEHSVTFFIASLGFVILFFFTKKMVYRVAGMVFEGVAETNEYLFNMDNYNRVLGLTLFPIVTLIAFYPAEDIDFLLFTGISIVGVFYIFMLQRGIVILLKKHFSKFYLFLYLCTLEFLPLLLIYKVVVV